MDLVLRSNISNNEYPLGYFHPHEDVWPVKKENVGLIEVMGLAILPSRLLKEMNLIKESLVEHKEMDLTSKHKMLIGVLLKHNPNQNIDRTIEAYLGERFVKGLTDCGVLN